MSVASHDTEPVIVAGRSRKRWWVLALLMLLAGLGLLELTGVTRITGTAAQFFGPRGRDASSAKGGPGQKAKPEAPRPEPAKAPERLLPCLFHPYRIVEVDFQGKQLFRSNEAVRSACGCEGLPGGRRFFADYHGGSVIEMDAKGQVIRSFEMSGGPNSLQRLPNGNLVVALCSGHEVVELQADGKEVWRVAVDGDPTDARRLENGRTLVALYTPARVVEVDRDGKVVWEIPQVSSPESARRLASGNTLVASSKGEVLEFSPAGKVVWSVRNVPKAYDALELPSGNVLIGYESGLREVTRAGNIVRELPVGTVRRIACY